MREIMRSLLSANLTVTGILMFIGSIIVFSGSVYLINSTNDLIAIKYLESLEKVAEGKATKIFLPADLSATLGSIGAISELFKDDDAKGSEESTKK